MQIKKSVLVVEDDSGLRELISECVREIAEQVIVVVAADGVDGYQKASRQQFDLLVTDLQMPRKDGTQLIEAINNLHLKTRPKSIVVFSGFITDLVKQRFGNVTYISKPCTSAELKEKLVKALGARVPDKIAAKVDGKTVVTFVDAAHETIKTICGGEVSRGTVEVKKSPDIIGEVRALVPIENERFRGSVALIFDRNYLVGIIGPESAKVKELAQGLALKIVQRALNKLNQMGFVANASTPLVALDSQVEVRHVSSQPGISARFNTKFGHMTIEVVIGSKTS